MYNRIAMGSAILLGTASCVAPNPGALSSGAGAAAPAIASVAPTSAVPAGPSLALLSRVGQEPVAAPAAAFALAPPFENVAQSGDAGRALDCLTAAVYYEARSEPTDGQRAVAQVVLNRVRNAAFPNSVCGVVYEGASRGSGCQFTFTCDGAMAARREPAAWERARAVAQDALAGYVYAPVGSATYYHTTAVHPWWADSLARIGTIGAHIFYTLAGSWASGMNFHQSYGGVEPTPVAGTTFPERGVRDVIDALEAGVMVHRQDSARPDSAVAAASPDHATTRFGVRIHRGDEEEAATDTATTHNAAGVVVHVAQTERAGPAVGA